MTIEVGERVAAPSKSVPEVLRHAARVIEEHGWCQGIIESGGRVCAYGAIATAAGTLRRFNVRNSYLEETAYHALAAQIGTLMVPSWNDQPGRTAAEVTAALRAAANAYEAR